VLSPATAQYQYLHGFESTDRGAARSGGDGASCPQVIEAKAYEPMSHVSQLRRSADEPIYR
jgi:hypothetical protein